MLRTVDGRLITIIVTVLCSGICGLQVNREDAVAVTNKKYGNSNLDLETLQLREPLLEKENDVEIISEDDIEAILRTIEKKQNENEEEQKHTTFGEADNTVKQRVTRQAAHQYTPLYPQLPSGPPYNPYQPQPNNNPSGQNPYQQQPGHNPYSQNPNQQQPPYNPYTQNPNQQQPGYNPYAQNPSQQQPGYNPYAQNPNQQQPGYNPYTQNPNQQQPAYNPYGQNGQQPTLKPAGQGQFPQRPPQWNTHNSSQPSNPNFNPNTGFFKPNQSPYGPSAGQNPYNSRPNFPSYNTTQTSPGSSYRPPSGQYPLQNQTFNYQPSPGSFTPPNASGSGFTTPLAPYNPRPGQPPYNNFTHSSGNGYPVQPSQYPSYNNSRPNPNPNFQYPNFPGTRPAQGTYNVTQHQASPYFPGPDGRFPSNSYNPSIPNYPPQKNNQGQNNFYPQNNNSASYDPRRVPPQNFSY